MLFCWLLHECCSTSAVCVMSSTAKAKFPWSKSVWMTKELKLEECVNLLSGSVSGGASSSGAYRHQKGHHHRHQNKPTSLLPPNSPYASGGNAAGSSPGHNENSTFAGQSLITSTPKAMIRRNSKNELRGAHQCTIRLLDDSEILQCEFQV